MLNRRYLLGNCRTGSLPIRDVFLCGTPLVALGVWDVWMLVCGDAKEVIEILARAVGLASFAVSISYCGFAYRRGGRRPGGFVGWFPCYYFGLLLWYWPLAVLWFAISLYVVGLATPVPELHGMLGDILCAWIVCWRVNRWLPQPQGGGVAPNRWTVNRGTGVSVTPNRS